MYQVGQKVKVVKNLCGHEFRIGQIVKVAKLDSHGEILSCESRVSKTSWFVDEKEVIPVKPFPLIKFLKAICIILGLVFFFGLMFIPGLFGEAIKNYIIEWTLLILDFVFLLICFFGYKVLKDHEEIDRDYMELGNKKPR